MRLKKLLSAAVSAVIALSPVFSNFQVSSKAAEHSVTFSYFDTNINGGEPIRGVDISSVISIENAGVKFYNEYGQEQDIFRTLSENGVNYIRVRVWNEPNDGNGHSYGGGNNDVKVAGEIGKRAAQYGMKLLVDIQYSDFWADPAKQTRPKYWQPHDHDKLKGEIYKWTSWVLESITNDGGDIGMVQVGNETNCFFCGEKDMYKICDLFASGNKAVRDFDRSILIAHHFANPGKADNYKWYAKVMSECKLDYDVFATSYYPYWHGSLENLTSVMKYIGDTYHKYVMVAETAYPYTNEDGDDFGNAVTSQSQNVDLRYDISVEGQAECLTDVFQAIADTGRWGLGVFYWEPAWIGTPDKISWEQRKAQWDTYGSGWATDYAKEYDKDVDRSGGSSYDNQGLFDRYGKPLESLKVFTRIYPQQEKQRPVQGIEVAEGRYRIRNAGSGKYLSVINGEERPGASVIQYKADGAADYNTWYVKPAGDGSYELYSGLGEDSALLLEFDPEKGYDYNTGISSSDGSDTQRFIFVATERGMYIATKESSGHHAIELDEAVIDEKGNVRRQLSNAVENLMWVLEPVEEFVLFGDLNGDDRVDTFDMILLRKSVTGTVSSSAADVNDDGETGIADLVKLGHFLLGSEKIGKTSKGTPQNTIIPRI